MPVSASPWGNLLSQQIKSPESFTADRQAVEAGGITNALNTAKLGEYQQGLQRSEQLRNMLSSGAGSDQLMKGGFLKEGMDLAKNNADVGNINAEETGRRVESFAKKAAIMRSSIGSVPTPQAAARYMQQAFADPDMGPVMKQFGTLEDALSEIPSNPNDFRNWQMQASEGIGKLVDHAEEQRTQAENERNNKAQRGIAARNASTAEGQLVVSRQRLKLDQQAPKGHYDSERGTVTDLRTGVAQPVTMGGQPLAPRAKAVAATEDERKAVGWFNQADNAWKNMQAAMGGVDPKTGGFKNADVARPGIADAIAAVPSFGIGEVVGNTLRSPERQKFNQGASSLSEAILRAATGAGVNRDEALQKVRELTPVFGEDSSTTKQKMDSIPMYLNSLKQRAGRAMSQPGGNSGGASGGWGDGWSIEEVK